VSLAVVLGFVVGLGGWVAWTGLRPVDEPLALKLARFDRRPVAAPTPAPGPGEAVDRDARIGDAMLRRLPWLARAVGGCTEDLRVLGRTPQEQAVRVGSYVLLAGVLAPWTVFVWRLVGVSLPLFVPLAIAIVGAAAGVLVPFRSLRSEAGQRRQDFVHALAAWCDVVVMSLASGRGVTQAMQTAAAAGEGWPFVELRAALSAAHLEGVTPWEALDALGTELGVEDLSTLASMIAMAGEEGAAVRQTVAAKARTIREKITSDTELAAGAMTEVMSLPNVVLVMGFLLFLGYPALVVMFQISR
jgi:tight adherence protein C